MYLALFMENTYLWMLNDLNTVRTYAFFCMYFGAFICT